MWTYYLLLFVLDKRNIYCLVKTMENVNKTVFCEVETRLIERILSNNFIIPF